MYDNVLAPYYLGKDPIRGATLARFKGAGLAKDLAERERASLFVLAELLAASGLAARQFFDAVFPYCNRDNFRLYMQGSQGDSGGAAITSRRRDGGLTQFWSSDHFRVQKSDREAHPWTEVVKEFRMRRRITRAVRSWQSGEKPSTE